jgi:hypothetical protein
MSEFEVFDRGMLGRSWRRPRPAVTVHRCGRIAFNGAAMAALGSPPAVEYLADREGRVLGFRTAEPGSRDAYRVSGKSHTASARLVLRYLEADLSVTRRYPLTESGGVPCIDLGQPGELVTYRSVRAVAGSRPEAGTSPRCPRGLDGGRGGAVGGVGGEPGGGEAGSVAGGCPEDLAG